MKKTKLLFMLLALFMGVAHMQAQKAYAVFSGTTLTFYYDSSSGSRSGKIYNLNSGTSAPGWYSDGNYANVTSVVFNSNFASARPTSCTAWFRGMTKLTSITGINYLNTSNVTTMKQMFYNSSALKSLTLTGFNTSKVTDMSHMFDGCAALTSLNLSSFNTAAVTTFKAMFQKCGGLGSLDVSKFSTTKATDMSYMFNQCSKITSLDVSNITINSTSVVTKYMLAAGNQLTSLTINATAANLEADACMTDGTYKTPCALNYPQGFTPEKTETTSTYYKWKSGYFKDGTTTGGGSGTVKEYTVLNGSTLTFYYDNKSSTRTGSVFFELGEPGVSPGWESVASSVKTVAFDSSYANARPLYCNYWFYNMTNLTSITGMAYLNTSETREMLSMFNNCSSLTSIDLSHFNTEKVECMDYMFTGCSKLTSLDLSKLQLAYTLDYESGIGQVVDQIVLHCNRFLYGCSSLKSLTIPKIKSVYVGSVIDPDVYDHEEWIEIYDDVSPNLLPNDAFYGVGTASSPCALNYPQGFTPEKSSSTSTYYIYKSGYFKDGTITGGGSGTVKAYTVFSGSTLTFYYDNKYGSRSGSVYDLNTGSNAPGWYANRTSVKTVAFDSSFKEYQPETTYQWFYGMSNLTTINNISNLDTESVTNMAQMFRGCSSLASVDVSKWDVSSVTTFSRMFQDCTSLTAIHPEDWENYDVVTNLEYMFSGCTKLEEVYFSSGAYQTGNYIDFDSNFKTSKVTTMSNMFAGCTNLKDIQLAFTLGKSVNTSSMFNNCSKLEEVALTNDWKSLNENAFNGVGTASSPCRLQYSSSFEDTFQPSEYAPNYFRWKGGYFTDLRHSFAVLDGTTLTFYHGDSEGFDMMGDYEVYSLNTAENAPGWRSVAGTIKKVVINESFKNARPTSTYTWFYNMTNITSITGLQYINTSYLTNTAGMFNGCSKLATLDLSAFDTSKVTRMQSMFKGCSALTELDLSKFVFSSSSVVTTDFLLNCKGLKKLTVPITANVLASAACTGVGTSTAPCELVTPSGFNLEKTQSTSTYFVWKGGYFKNSYREGDMNKDGKINVTDVMILVDIILHETDQ